MLTEMMTDTEKIDYMVKALKKIHQLCEAPHWTAARRWEISGIAIDAAFKGERS